ncbi:MAG: ATP-binding protein, partial [Verrucomicrobia bacterium]|nr:ATP-binding protein [Verrucomicrobiota bacterium]
EAEPANARRELAAVRNELDTVITEIRQFITAEAGTGKPVDFGAVLRALVQRASAGATAQIEAHCEPGASDRLSGDQAVHLANIAREALSNSLRHAQPQRVEIALRSERESVRLEISDDGAGFDPQAPGRSGVGLTSMAARAKEAGGTLAIQSSPGKGTGIVVGVPVAVVEPTEPE